MGGPWDAVPVVNNEPVRRFEARAESRIAFAKYRITGSSLLLLHTEVPPELQGQGIAGRLARAALDYARERRLSVVPYCPFMIHYLAKHPEDQPLVDPAHRERVLGHPS